MKNNDDETAFPVAIGQTTAGKVRSNKKPNEMMEARKTLG